ncbi:MAG: pyridoxamine 5'-phosphate oxidase family protein [Nitritalea sp.]
MKRTISNSNMLISPGTDLETVFKDLKHELHRAVLDRRHPFRLVMLATVDEGQPDARYIVLRQVTQELRFLFYTDGRTPKVRQLEQNPQAALLFYHPGQRAQVRVLGHFEILQQGSLWEEHRQRVQGEALKAYSPTLAPGRIIQQPEQAYAWEKEHDWFTLLAFRPKSMELLQLQGLEHLRAYFRYEQASNTWKKEWVAP